MRWSKRHSRADDCHPRADCRHSRAGGNPERAGAGALDPRLRGDDELAGMTEKGGDDEFTN
jgi:hypothetical protein